MGGEYVPQHPTPAYATEDSLSVMVNMCIQALQEGKAVIWNRTNAIDWLLNHQGPDGAFFDVATTAEVIIALARVSGVAEGIADHCDVRPGAGELIITYSYLIAGIALNSVSDSRQAFCEYRALLDKTI